MKYFFYVFVVFSLYSCSEVVSQVPSEEVENDKEFQEIMKLANEAQLKNKEKIKAMDEKTEHKIKQAAEKIVELEQTVVELKEEINEIKGSDTVDLHLNFRLLPISKNGQNRK